MITPIYPIVAADAAVRSILGDSPVRFYSFGQAPEKPTYPYAVFQIATGSPENYLGGRPDIDSLTVQVDVYGRLPANARSAALALRDAIEPHAHITLWRGEEVDPATKALRIGFDCDWWVPRSAIVPPTPEADALLFSGDQAPGGLLLSGDQQLTGSDLELI